MDTNRIWLVLSLGAEREYAGNQGYADELTRLYRYDSFVPNHLQLNVGDLLIICDRKQVLGLSRIARIDRSTSPKMLSRCPTCRISTIKMRTQRTPAFRCREGHTFDEPVRTPEPCTHFIAWFDGSFRPPPTVVPVEHVRHACPRYNGQLAMQEVVLSLLGATAKPLVSSLTGLAMPVPSAVLLAQDAEEAPYVPDEVDAREIITRAIRARRGQAVFRQELRERFADTCVITRCGLVDLLEAAHIAPYRGEKDNHVSNGLLLRADIHTLFDLDLLGIHPETLTVSLHPRVVGMGYDPFHRIPLACDATGISREALESRWEKFQSRQKPSS
ncbi:HNH endonuclease signature motif containing protein [Corallococcus sp. BB11-1]|uniref:HNH endonuclease n=1 Tax=Corallococcus sp. BB11-1 TaxID=2996783 RepID=UPI0010EA238D|nr:HNH endonuclease signature motif containing protein [Corallococcus sp. BB11-1]MCY1031649.1 HNH endonuclease signature motif containing protein [Corallococcus sp. BB11-1]RYZ17912.1 MAG: HNH endonuclease [Myxococcaceae bacterium]